jgi:hypothetical protein
MKYTGVFDAVKRMLADEVRQQQQLVPCVAIQSQHMEV